ncbi:MAG: DUF4417 domain-containing protein [Oscillatoriales cyanobacterium RM1_1_9]|nr:DUF4417 domain-containing protein [Oscillatoriales cyanobacterium RM1_1_9]
MIQDDAPINLIEDAISNNVDCIWTMWRYRYEVNVPGRGVANIMELDYDYMDLAVNYIKQEAIGVIGRMGFASLPPCGFVPERLVPYSSQLSKRLDRDGVAVHFWKPRNQHLWTFPNRGLAALRRYPCVLSPTIYTDSSQPFWRRVMLHGLKQELAAYWSSQGLSVLPVVGWCDRSDFEFCLDGIPKESVIAIPGIERRSVELPGDALYRQSLFLDGLELLEQSIYPSSLVLAGGSQAQFSRVSEAVSCLVVHLCL